MDTKLHSWACHELSKIGIKDCNQIVSYLMEIEEEDTIEQYLVAMLDTQNPDHKYIISEFMKRLVELNNSLAPGFYRKPEFNEEIKLDSKVKSKKEKIPGAITSSQSELSTGNSRKKNKFVSLYSEDGENRDVILLPGRHKCDCQASKHKLINNCLNCGRIVCEQEGSGPCAFCKNLVASKDEKDIINKGTKKSEALQNKLLHSKKIQYKEENVNDSSKAALMKAIEHKNKLLEYDLTSEKRTKVYDDENDYFQSSSKWVNPANREKLQKLEEDMKLKKYDRSSKKVTIDLLGRAIVGEVDDIIYGVDNPIIKELLEDEDTNNYFHKDGTESMSLLNLSRPVYIEDRNIRQQNTNRVATASSKLHRIQDKTLQEMSDEGMCLSMHQPWASLLVMGIKIHEGRTWYGSHRGRLWIASASKNTNPSEVSELEQRYRVLLNDDNIKFPLNYPSSCLLGFVDVIDVLPQEQYRVEFPNGESDSPFVFVCENPKEMTIKFPMKGEHKIFKLDSKIHTAAKKLLRV